MKSTRILVIAIIGALIGGATGFGIKLLNRADDSLSSSSTEEGLQPVSRLPTFSYPDLNERVRHAEEWQDRILVLNFWAAWCPPCREEMPMFMELQKQYAQDNVRFVGIAIDDREPIQDFVNTHFIEYPILLGDLEAIKLSKRLGNLFEGLPFTVVVEPGGNIIFRHQGLLSREQLEPVLDQAIHKNRRTFATPERI